MVLLARAVQRGAPAGLVASAVQAGVVRQVRRGQAARREEPEVAVALEEPEDLVPQGQVDPQAPRAGRVAVVALAGRAVVALLDRAGLPAPQAEVVGAVVLVGVADLVAVALKGWATTGSRPPPTSAQSLPAPRCSPSTRLSPPALRSPLVCESVPHRRAPPPTSWRGWSPTSSPRLSRCWWTTPAALAPRPTGTSASLVPWVAQVAVVPVGRRDPAVQRGARAVAVASGAPEVVVPRVHQVPVDPQAGLGAQEV